MKDYEINERFWAVLQRKCTQHNMNQKPTLRDSAKSSSIKANAKEVQGTTEYKIHTRSTGINITGPYLGPHAS